MPFRAFDLAEVAETLRESEQRYRALFERAPAPILVIDAGSLAILGVNDAAMTRYGYSRAEFLTRSLRDLWPPAERATLHRAQAALAAGHEVRGVFRHWSRTHELFDVELHTRSLPFGDERLRVMHVFDVTEHTRSADVSSYLDRASSLFAASLEIGTICRNLALIAATRLGDWCAVHRVFPEGEGEPELMGFAHTNPLDELVVEAAVRARLPLPPNHPVRAVASTGRARVIPPGDHGGMLMRCARHTGATAMGDGDRRLAVRGAMYLPIQARGQVVAVLECIAAGDDHVAEATNLLLGEELASRAALALGGALQYEEARRQAVPRSTDLAALFTASGEHPESRSLSPDAGAELVLENIGDGFAAVDAGWRLTFVNRVAEQIFGCPREELLTRVLWEAVPDLAGTAFEREYRRAAATGERVEFEAHHPHDDSWYRVRVLPSPSGLGIFFHETTAAHRAEAERRDSNRVLYEYAEQATDLIHLLSPDGRIVYANRAWRETLGYDVCNGETMRLLDIVAPEFRAIALGSLKRRLAGDTTHVLEVDVLAKDGRRIRVQGGGTCRFVQGQPIAVLGIFRDVTARRESEAALEAARRATVIANRTKTEFLDRVNHELRTPLTGIIGFARLLERNRSGGMSPTEVDFAARISRQGRELLAVIEDVLAYTEIEGRRLTLEVSPVQLGGVVEEVVAQFAERAARAGTAIVTTIPAGLAPLETDAGPVSQILRHLVDNAIKFSGGEPVTVSVVADPATGRPLRVEVSDHGIGLPQGQEGEMLEPFQQAAQDTTRKYGGMGLGLTISRALARLLGFELTLRSVPGEGTRAVLTFADGEAAPTAGEPGRLGGVEGETPERESAELSTLLQTIVRAAPLAIIVYDSQLVVRLWNDTATRIFGWTPEEAIGMRLPTVLPEEQPRFRELLRRVVETGGMTEEPMKRQRKDGSLLDAHSSIAPLRDPEGRLIGFVSLVADVTEQHRREEQLRQSQKMEVIGQLAGGVAHDFNNVLTVIHANASFLMEELDAGDPRRADAEEIRVAAGRAAALTRQLLLFARKQKPERRVVDLRDVVSEARRMLERLIGSNIELATLNATEECPVLADPGQLEQLVMNLVLNARDAMPQGGPLVVETRRATSEAGRDEVVLVVSDTGHGMTPETVKHIFEPFFTTKGAGQGTGLGLATVDAIVADAGGRIQVESAPGAGTIFSVHFPATTWGTTAVAAPPVPAPLKGSETVLLVEDEEAVRSVASRILLAQGYTVLTARHGKDALDLARRHEGAIDLLITDLVMPEMDGYTLADRLRELRPELRVVFMSGYSEPPTTGGPGTAGSAHDTLVQKPFSSDELAAAARQALD